MDKREKKQIELFRSLYKEHGSIKKAKNAFYEYVHEPFYIPERLIELNIDIEMIEALYDKYDSMQVYRISDFLRNDAEVADILEYISPDYSFRQLEIVISALTNAKIREFVIEHLNDYFSTETDENMMEAIRDACMRELSSEHIEMIAERTAELSEDSRNYLIRGLTRYPDFYSRWIEKLIDAGNEKIRNFYDIFYFDENDNKDKIDDKVIDFFLTNSFSRIIEEMMRTLLVTKHSLNVIRLVADRRLSDSQMLVIYNLVFGKEDNYAKAVELKKCFLNGQYSDTESDSLRMCIDKITKEQFQKITELDTVAVVVEEMHKYSRENLFSINTLVDKLGGRVFSEEQSKVIFEAIHDGLPLEKVLIIAEPELSIQQMEEIRLGFVQWVNAEEYAKKELSSDEMWEIRRRMLLESLNTEL